MTSNRLSFELELITRWISISRVLYLNDHPIFQALLFAVVTIPLHRYLPLLVNGEFIGWLLSKER